MPSVFKSQSFKLVVKENQIMMVEQTDVETWQDLFTSIIEDADSNILLLDDEFRVINLNPSPI